MKKIKVLHLITRLIAGGAQGTALAIANGLDRNRFNVTFACGPQDFDTAMAARWDRDLMIIPDLIREIHPIKDIKALAQLYLFLKKNKFDIVNTHTSKAGFLGRIASKLAGVPIIFYTPHGSIYRPFYFGPIATYFLSRLENFAVPFTDKIITCSVNEKKDLLGHNIGREDRYTTIYWGRKQPVSLKTPSDISIRQEFNIPEEAPLFGLIGRFVAEKGHLFCLEAFKKVLDSLPGAILLIVGDGPLRNDIESKIKEMCLGRNVIMTGHREDIAKILASLDISLHTSFCEGTPIAIMEAMFAGKAIIATAVGGIPEMIVDGESGILIPSGNSKALANAITALSRDKELARRIGEAAHKRAMERFTLEMMIENITKLYNDFIESKITNKD